ncbi:DUF1206 domain-containing protein [Flexivirga alba]|uniref:DUF1206 domain-containing protein n=1 Tax=Flexivirga alba TaxID=702742 RepID=A0ABW2ACI2_9MICO
MSEARDGVRQVNESGALDVGARVGFAASGVLHLLIAYLAVRVAFHRSGKSPDQSGALATLAQNAAGKVLLIVFVAGFLALALWQLSRVFVTREVTDRLQSGALTVVYLAMGWSALSFVRQKGRSSASTSTDFTATVMKHSGGRWLVAIIGLVIIGIGIYHVQKGIRTRFLKELREHPGAAITWTGRIGYGAKGIALGIVGALFVIAAAKHRSSQASGLDGALSTLRHAVAGQLLLTLMALGLAAFGVYSLARVRYGRV